MVLRRGDTHQGAADDRVPQGSGKADFLRWLIGVAMAAFVAYFTTISTLNQGLAEVRERQKNQFEEIMRRLEMLQVDIRDMRSRER